MHQNAWFATTWIGAETPSIGVPRSQVQGNSNRVGDTGEPVDPTLLSIHTIPAPRGAIGDSEP